ncbi:MAG: GNAT family N-acetyltransferase [Cyclobacteriaceae bacterium]
MIRHIDDNFFQHSWKIPSQSAGMVVTHLKSLTFVDSGLSCDTFNIIHIHDGLNLSKEELSNALQHFKSRNLEYCIWINGQNLSVEVKDYLEEQSVSEQNKEVGMVLDLKSYKQIGSEQHSNIEIVKNSQQLTAYATVIAENWSPPDENVIKYYDRTSSQYLSTDSKIILLVYYHEGKPVSTVEMFPSSRETIGLYGFATLSSHRGLGIGTSLMTFALNKCKEVGYTHAILQASEDGIGIYRKFGFKELTTYFEYA